MRRPLLGLLWAFLSLFSVPLNGTGLCIRSPYIFNLSCTRNLKFRFFCFQKHCLLFQMNPRSKLTKRGSMPILVWKLRSLASFTPDPKLRWVLQSSKMYHLMEIETPLEILQFGILCVTPLPLGGTCSKCALFGYLWREHLITPRMHWSRSRAHSGSWMYEEGLWFQIGTGTRGETELFRTVFSLLKSNKNLFIYPQLQTKSILWPFNSGKIVI